MDDRRDPAIEPAEGRGRDEAVFQPSRIGGASGASAGIVALSLTLGVVGAIIGAAVFRGPAARPGSVGAAPTLPPTTSRDVAQGQDTTVPRPTPTTRPEQPKLVLETRLGGGYLFVHGDVFTRDAIIVVVSLTDPADHIVDVRSVDVPQVAAAARAGVIERFHLAFELSELGDLGWVRANAYNSVGKIIATVREPVGQRSVIEAPAAYRT